jgi:hypothetical protein
MMRMLSKLKEREIYDPMMGMVLDGFIFAMSFIILLSIVAISSVLLEFLTPYLGTELAGNAALLIKYVMLFFELLIFVLFYLRKAWHHIKEVFK